MPKTAKEIVQSAVDEKKAEQKGNYTFRLNNGLLKRFREHCEKKGVTMSHVIEKFFEDLVSNDSKK